jgi:hypothetical protein
MIELPRELARRFRAVLRQSLMVEGPRGPWPVLVVRAEWEVLTLQACNGEMALRGVQAGAVGGAGALAFRSDLLAQFQGRSAGPVTLEAATPGQGRARWEEAGVSRTIEFEAAAPEAVPKFPALPREFIPMPAGLLQALAEAAYTTPRINARYAMTRVLLRGKAGQVIATDGKQLLAQNGFSFPWAEDLLVPRLPACGLKELASEEPVEVGRTADHVAVRAGAWTFLLAIDKTARYPDVKQVIPRPGPQASCLRFHPDDTAFLLATWRELPGRDAEYSPITLDLGSPPCVRARDGEQGRVTELVLHRSAVTGPPVRMCLDRYYLGQALHLGFRELIVPGPDAPLLCRDASRTYLWMPLTGQEALAPTRGMRRLSPEGEPLPPAPTTRRRSDPMPAPQPTGQHPEPNNRPHPPEPERTGIEELIAEAEALRGLLHDASARGGRLVVALKQQRRQSHAVRQAMHTLRRLHHLGG